jgi:hypothetical protein
MVGWLAAATNGGAMTGEWVTVIVGLITAVTGVAGAVVGSRGSRRAAQLAVEAEQHARHWERSCSAAEAFMVSGVRLLDVCNLNAAGVEEVADFDADDLAARCARSADLAEKLNADFVAVQLHLPTVRGDAGRAYDSVIALQRATYPHDRRPKVPRRSGGRVPSLDDLWQAANADLAALRPLFRRALGLEPR